MRRSELEHAIRAACDVAEDHELVVIGSQAVLGQFPDAPDDLLWSREVDVFPRNHPERSEAIDGALGEFSLFHQTHRFYIHGVGPETAILPSGWEGRLVPVKNANTRGCTGWCLEAHDLAVSKLAAGREKDVEFVSSLLSHELVKLDQLRGRIELLPLDDAARREVAQRAEVAARDRGSD